MNLYHSTITKKVLPCILATLVIVMQTIISPLFVLANPEISPRAGNINLDLDISPASEEILSGETGNYLLNLKGTGSITTYTNVKITVDLPTNANFTQNLSELIIADVTPTYDSSNHTLTYVFSEFVTGQVYTTIIKVIPENGTTLNDTTLVSMATIISDQTETFSDEASIKVIASGGLAINKAYSATVGKTLLEAPVQGDIGIWTIAMTLMSETTGLMFVKEESQIIIVDTIPKELTYVSDDAGGVYNASSRTVTWTFPAPTIEEQQNIIDKGESFLKTINIQFKFNENIDNYTTITNSAEATVTLIDNTTISSSKTASIQIASGSGVVEIPGDGIWYYSPHRGPSDNKGNVAGNDDYNPVPTVYNQGSILGFAYQYLIAPTYNSTTTLSNGKSWNNDDVFKNGYQGLTMEYSIDPNLNMSGFYFMMPNNYANTKQIGAPYPLDRIPDATISLNINGVWQDFEVDWSKSIVRGSNTYFYPVNKITPSNQGIELTLKEDDKILGYKITFENKDGVIIHGGIHVYSYHAFTIDEGYIGEVNNSVKFSGTLYDGTTFTKVPNNRISPMGDRQAIVVPIPKGVDPISKATIEFGSRDGNSVQTGDNTITVRFYNDASSIVNMHAPFEGMILLPAGVTLRNIEPLFSAAGGSYESITNDYNNTGRQLIKVKWNNQSLIPSNFVYITLYVTIADNAPSMLTMDVNGFSGDEKISVPETSDNLITDSTIEVDIDDLNGDGNITQSYVHSGNRYVLLNNENVQTELLVKGDLDTEYSKFGYTIPGGNIDYQLTMTNKTSAPISMMTLVEVLPSIGDLGITDNVNRGSAYTPKMLGPIDVPTEWQDKVEVYYSTETNPKRNDLVKNTIYPDTTLQLQNPVNATDPNWIKESEVIDWGEIHSYKIELKDGVQIAQGENITLQFRMQAPSYLEIMDYSILDQEIDPINRAAWNSFAYAVDTLQVVEPARVGVAIIAETPKINKDIEGKAYLELASRDESFTWKVKTEFGNSIADSSQVIIKDEINSLFEIQSVVIEDVNGINVSDKGVLDIADNKISFALNQEEGSYSYLIGQTYIMKITTVIGNTVSDEELIPYIQNGGIPNEATLTFGDGSQVIISEKPKVTVVEKETPEPPKTGDVSGMMVISMLLLGSVASFIVLIKKRKTD